MNTRILLVALLVCFAAALTPTFASADAGTTVTSDLTQLGNEVTAAHDAIVADASSVTTAAQGGDKATTKAAVAKLRSDLSTLLTPVLADRKQLFTDLQAARAANVSGLGAEVGPALKADRAAIREIRQAIRQARKAVRALRQASQTTQT